MSVSVPSGGVGLRVAGWRGPVRRPGGVGVPRFGPPGWRSPQSGFGGAAVGQLKPSGWRGDVGFGQGPGSSGGVVPTPLPARPVAPGGFSPGVAGLAARLALLRAQQVGGR